jgi:hypothetical protein
MPQRVDRKDLSSARVFSIFFTRIITSIIDVLRDQCQIPLILPNAVQTFEDIVLAIFQSYYPASFRSWTILSSSAANSKHSEPEPPCLTSLVVQSVKSYV